VAVPVLIVTAATTSSSACDVVAVVPLSPEVSFSAASVAVLSKGVPSKAPSNSPKTTLCSSALSEPGDAAVSVPSEIL
jgi:hypothetical protein